MLNKKVMVVCGGISTERDISLKSGEAVFNGLKKYGYKNVELFDLNKENMQHIVEHRPDAVYLALHGKGGEDGAIQGLLELFGIPYTGPGIASSAICMNKIFTKEILKANNIPTAKYIVKNRRDCENINSVKEEILTKLGLPAVLKSPCQGSSIGVVLVKDEENIVAAIEEIFNYGDQLLAEEFLEGVEITLPIMGNDELTILPDVEITSEREFYDYKAKYTQGLCHHIIPARISEDDRKKVIDIGINTYKVLGCCGLSRIDFFVDDIKGPMVVEVNTSPGMTEMSLFPDSARHYGIPFETLVSMILECGINTVR